MAWVNYFFYSLQRPDEEFSLFVCEVVTVVVCLAGWRQEVVRTRKQQNQWNGPCLLFRYNARLIAAGLWLQTLQLPIFVLRGAFSLDFDLGESQEIQYDKVVKVEGKIIKKKKSSVKYVNTDTSF